MEERNNTGKRQQRQKWAKVSTVVVVVCACASVLLVCAYVGVCIWASSHILPNSAAGSVDLSGLSYATAETRLKATAADYQDQTVILTCFGENIPCKLNLAGLAYDIDSVIRQLSAGEDSFLRRGITWLKASASGKHHEARGAVVFQNRDYLDKLLAKATATLNQPVVQHQVMIGETYITLKRGQTGMVVDTQKTIETLLDHLSECDLSDIPLEIQITEPDEIDFTELYQQVYREPLNAAMDSNTYEIIPDAYGVSFMITTAQALFERTEPGGTCRVPLVLTDPEITAEELEASLFSDLLGEAKSTVGGINNRVSNVRLAGAMCNGSIVMPGEEFSYWSKISPCSAAQGFLPAPAYSGGKTVQATGGGVCQMSSSIYYAALLSNLEIVERHNHSYAIEYLPDGCDAMFSAGYSDFRFKNNTPYPIKIMVTLENRNLSVQIWGTKTDDTYVQIETKPLSWANPTTIYQIDNSVPEGTTQVEQTAYTGRNVETYRCIYTADGTLISKTLESVSNYQKRDAIVLVNSADAAKYGLGGEVIPKVTPMPLEEIVPHVESAPLEEIVPPVESVSIEGTVPPAESAPIEEIVPPVESASIEGTVPPAESAPIEETVSPVESTLPEETVPPPPVEITSPEER